MSGKWKWLQFFADGASGGDGGDAGAGVTSGDAGQNTGVKTDDAGQRLEKLGVPREKADKFRKSMAKRGVKPQPEEAPADSDKEWDDFMAKPAHQQRMQNMMAERGKSATEARNAAQEQIAVAQEQMKKLDPLMQLLARRYSVEASNVDAVIKAATEDDLFFEDEALERGESVSKVKSDWQKSREDQQKQAEEREKELQEHFWKMQQQADELKQEFPNFDFQQELKNPEFLFLTSPQIKALAESFGCTPYDVRKAFKAAHMEEIEKQQVEAVASRAKADAARAAQAGQARPKENGSSAAPFNATPNLKTMTKEERLAWILSRHPPNR